ncbi:MAG: MerR family transcriptional regulator [Bacillus sp. (in: Bacteria)]|uniref:MerR family transcriptional regulator n=1 Tax=unclassified Exiguobacterium TaxID=2644629 RepID=UPI001BE605AC|nr:MULTISPECIES: MerR family transcriptional regulator [unclassified Exiguobacterium]MBR3207064.1 MerR family transcriptional regulator [Bacillus sp. (in: firmicutes)]
MKGHWKVGEVAELAGLTIRTLRYYDQICLFSPSQYTESGHRLYTKADLERLQPILSLKQMGMSLEEIQLLLSNPEEQTVAEILQTQISRVKKEIEVQQKLVAELENALSAAHSNRTLSISELTKLMEALKMNKEKYFSKQQLDTMESRYENADKQLLKQAEQEFNGLIKEIRLEKEKGASPSDKKVQDLAKKWNDIVNAFSEDDRTFRKQAEHFHAENPGNELQYEIDGELYQFINKALNPK